jgi:hypothetical protein
MMNIKLGGHCNHCGCSTAEALADARALGFAEEFQAGTYTCCQIDQWADEQWQAWTEISVEENEGADYAYALRKSA